MFEFAGLLLDFFFVLHLKRLGKEPFGQPVTSKLRPRLAAGPRV